MVQLIMPVGPSDRIDWLKISLDSAISQPVDEVIIYDNSERQDIFDLLSKYKDRITYVKDRRMKKVNMARLRNRMLHLTTSEYVIMMDSDVIIPRENTVKMLEKVRSSSFTWLHYAYSESEITKPLVKGENNPNLGCSALDSEVIEALGGFDERYERDEDIWLYAKLRKSGYSPSATDGRCLHLNLSHARQNLRSSLREARRNLWRSKYDMRLVRDGLVDVTFLTGYAYYGSYYLLGVLSVFFPLLSLSFIPLAAYGVYYYGGTRRYIYNLIPGLALILSLPYGLLSNL